MAHPSACRRREGPSACATPAAMRACPSGLAWIRSTLHRRRSVATSESNVSRTVTSCSVADSLVELDDARPEPASGRDDLGDFGERDRGDLGARPRQFGEHRLQVRCDRERVEAGAHHVVEAGDDGREVRPERERRAELLRADAAGEPAADGEIRVADTVVELAEPFGEPVRPAAVAGGLVPVAEAFRLAVAERHVAGEHQAEVPARAARISRTLLPHAMFSRSNDRPRISVRYGPTRGARSRNSRSLIPPSIRVRTVS